MDNKIRISNRLKELRNSKNLSQEELGKIIGITTSMIGMYETGARNPSYEILTKLADYFNCTTDYLLGRSSGPNNKIINQNELPQKWIESGVKSIEVFKTLNAKDLTFEDLQDILNAINNVKKRHE